MLRSVKNQILKVPGVGKLTHDLKKIMRGDPPITSGSIYDENVLAQLIGKDDPIILDIGCNDGSDTLWLLELFQRARIHSFEPDPRARARYLKQVLDKRATLSAVAISNNDGVAEFHTSNGTNPVAEGREKCESGWDLSGSLRKPKEHVEAHPWCTFDNTIKVETKKLDTWAQENGIGAIDLIWADVQGAEADLIEGGKEALQRTRYVYTEYNNQELYEGQVNLSRLLKLVPDFEVVHNYGNDVLLRNKRQA